jgi:hypothetical protein
MKKEGVGKMAVVSTEYGTLAIEVGLVFKLVIVFLSTRRTKLFGALAHFELGWRWRNLHKRDGDEWRRRYVKEDGNIEINNIPCVIRRRGPNSVRL